MLGGAALSQTLAPYSADTGDILVLLAGLGPPTGLGP